MKNQKLITKTINNQLMTFTEVDGILVETTDSFLARGGVIQVYAPGTNKLIGEKKLSNPSKSQPLNRAA